MYKVSLDTLQRIKKALKEYEKSIGQSEKSDKNTKKYKEIKKLNEQLEQYNT